ncbi:MAG: hypothetical protein FWE95_07070 [Planctomycetaceae bacterium]|nr:hypothetical protein [Planctomycetaceae bacterium]
MKKAHIFFPIVVLACLFAVPINAEEPRPTLKQQIEESVKRDRRPPGGFSAPNFDPHEVRKRFYGDEATFRREVTALLQSGEDDWQAHILVMFLDIHEEAISKILRERFASVDPLLQDRFCNLLARHPIKENLEFLVNVLERPDHSASLRVSMAYYLSYFQRDYFAGFDADLKDRILKTFLACLDDVGEVSYRFGPTSQVGDDIATKLGYFGSFAKPALPKVREKFISMQGDETDVGFLSNKLGLAWSIVCIAPEQSDEELEYILQKAVEGKSKDARWEAIHRLETIPVSLSEKVIPVLCTIIQKETSISNKVSAAEALKTLLEQQRWLTEHLEYEWDNAETTEESEQ